MNISKNTIIAFKIDNLKNLYLAFSRYKVPSMSSIAVPIAQSVLIRETAKIANNS